MSDGNQGWRDRELAVRAVVDALISVERAMAGKSNVRKVLDAAYRQYRQEWMARLDSYERLAVESRDINNKDLVDPWRWRWPSV